MKKSVVGILLFIVFLGGISIGFLLNGNDSFFSDEKEVIERIASSEEPLAIDLINTKPEYEEIVIADSEPQVVPEKEPISSIPGISDPKVVELLKISGRDATCPQEGFRKIWSDSDYKIIGPYKCSYRGEKSDNTYNEECKESFQAEFIRRKYSIVNECLYADGELVSETPLVHSLFNGEFGVTDYKTEGLNLFTSELLTEWHRFIDDNQLYILITGGAGCGGCIWNGPYLMIDLDTGEVQKKFYDFPYNPDVVFSPDGDKLLSIEYESPSPENQTLILLDIPTLTEREVYTVPSNQSLLESGHGIFLITDAIIWDNNDEVRVAQIKRFVNPETSEKGFVEYKDLTTQDFYKRYTFLGEPVKIEL